MVGSATSRQVALGGIKKPADGLEIREQLAEVSLLLLPFELFYPTRVACVLTHIAGSQSPD